MIKRKQFNYFSTYLIAAEAEKRGIVVNKIFTKGAMAKSGQIELRYKKHEEVIIGQRLSKTDCIGYWVAKNKELAKYFFREAGLKVATGGIFYAKEVEAIVKFCNKAKYPIVLKPVAGTHGSKVFLDVGSDRDVKRLLKNFKGKVIVEKQYGGEEYRLLATNKKFLAAIHRVPANVVGDGVHTVKELIEIKNEDPRRGKGHKKSLVKIRIDKTVKEYLKQTGNKLSRIPLKDETIYLRTNSNISTGGDSYDVTDIIHPAVKKLAVKVINSIPGLALGGIDYLTKDVTKAPSNRNYIIIEVNDSPMISMHHIPYQGVERNIAKEMIDMIFPETKGKYLE
jgi:cyanophycin synthetase